MNERAKRHEGLEALRSHPARFELFTALRLVEAAHAELPRLGTSRTPVEDPVRLGQDPYLEFEAATLQRVIPEEARLRIQNHAFGLFGPHGPLPLHLTEYAAERIRHAHDPGFAAFCDLFHHRLIALFYRAWANKEPTVHADRPEADRFAEYLDSIAGYFDAALRRTDAMPARHRRHFAARFTCRNRNAEGLAGLIRLRFRLPVAIEEFVGEWLPVPEDERGRLGASRLGGCVLGRRIWQRASRFRIRLGPMSEADYRRFLPDAGRERLAAIADIVRHWVGNTLAWDLNLVIDRESVPEPRLGAPLRLGWNLWLGGAGDRDRDDLHFDGKRLEGRLRSMKH